MDFVDGKEIFLIRASPESTGCEFIFDIIRILVTYKSNFAQHNTSKLTFIQVSKGFSCIFQHFYIEKNFST